MSLTCHFPITVEIVGELDQPGLARLSEKLEHIVIDTISAAERELAPRGQGAPSRLLAEPSDRPFEVVASGRWEGERYRVRSFGGDGSELLKVATPEVQEGTGSIEELTWDEIVDRIHSLYPQSWELTEHGPRYGVYVKMKGTGHPELYYLLPGQGGEPALDAIFLYIDRAGQRGWWGLHAGFYLLLFQSTGSGRLRNLSRGTSTQMANPEALDLVVTFAVGDLGILREARSKPPYRFYPVIRLVRLNHESPLAGGSRSEYAAHVDIWRVEDNGRSVPVSPLGFIFARLHFEWSVYRLKRGGPARGHLLHREWGHDPLFSYSWSSEGSYRVTCQVTVGAEEMSPISVSDSVHEDVMKLDVKLAWLLAAFEAEQAKTGGPTIWAATPREQIRRYELEIQAERAKASPNQSRIDALTEAITKMRQHLFPVGISRIGPISIHAVFLEKRTSKVQPINLFLAFEVPRKEGDDYLCYLIDVTYPAFYADYKGSGENPMRALIDAFETARTSFRRTYPPGHILAHITIDDLRSHGLADLPGFVPIDYVTETNSWQKEAMEWLTIGVQALGAAALAAAFVFPPSAVIGGALIVTGAAGAVLAAVNIVERIEEGNFAWDTEAYSDIASIAAGLVGAGGAMAGARGASLAAVLASAEARTAEEVAALSKLASVLKWQRALLLTGLGVDVSNALLVTYGTYQAISDFAASDDSQLLADYTNQFGQEDGLRRWREQRYTRLVGILVRAALNGALIGVSIRSNIGARKRASMATGGPELVLEERARASAPAEVRTPVVSIAGPAAAPPTAAELQSEVLRVERRVAELRAEASEVADRADQTGTNPERRQRLLNAAAMRRRVIAMVEADMAEMRAAADESEALARRTDLPSPEEIDQLIDQAHADHEPFRIKLRPKERRAAVDPSVLPRLRRALTTTAAGNRVVFRVEGGSLPTRRSKELVSIGHGGTVKLSRETSINLNFGSIDRAYEFLLERPGARIVAFEVPEKWIRGFRSAAIPESGTTELQGESRLVDIEAAGDQIQVNPRHIDELQRVIAPGSGREITP